MLTFRFLLSVAVIRHLQLDSHLPLQLLPPDWPADRLRADYRRHDTEFKHDLTAAGSGVPSGPPGLSAVGQRLCRSALVAPDLVR